MTVVLSVLRATADWTAYSSQNKTHFAYRFLVVRKLLSEVAKQEEHRRRSNTDLWIVQSDRSGRTNKSDRPIRSLVQTQDQQVGLSNQIARTDSGPTSRIVQSDCSDGIRTNKSDRPIRLLWHDQQVAWTNQSSSPDLLFVSTNQSSSTDLLSVSTNQSSSTDLLSVSTNQISSTDLLSVSTHQSSSRLL